MKIRTANKLASFGIVGLTALALTGCVGTKYLSEGITAEGHVPTENIVFPALDEAWQEEGQFANSENLSKIRPGITKDELYQLIGRPHFSEAHNAREWNYILKFYQPDDSVKICQYKVIFDEDYRGQEFYWSPADCPPEPATTAPTIIPAPVIVPAPVRPAVQETINLNADALFAFDKWQPTDMLAQGRQQLDELARVLSNYQSQGSSRIIITGHTDYLGADRYNMNLSQLRAQTVRQYLIQRGVDSGNLVAMGAGESEPVKQCESSLPRPQLINCLQPNRRVEINVNVTYTVPEGQVPRRR